MVQRGEGLRLHRGRRWCGCLRPLQRDTDGRIPHPRRRPAGRVRDLAGSKGAAGGHGPSRRLIGSGAFGHRRDANHEGPSRQGWPFARAGPPETPEALALAGGEC
ncbi:hypothetical protein SCOCK_220072 [Actinacidiphila cocklensis]|uniref:Uncharacterized protein n=1 Tax=Actinacidiphila cocklensis TaxID=887465 RepID=A0A9W4DPN3_9ACTN|nr:hypothetical protein SCOCK_220072 [Actinacidiphila cocklensis]